MSLGLQVTYLATPPHLITFHMQITISSELYLFDFSRNQDDGVHGNIDVMACIGQFTSTLRKLFLIHLAPTLQTPLPFNKPY